MSFTALVQMLFERGNAMQSFWGFYITVALGLVAFFGAHKRTRVVAALSSIAFVGFAAANMDGMTDAARQRQFLFEQLTRFPAGQAQGATSQTSDALPSEAIAPGLLKVAEPPTPEEVVRYHLACDFAVLVAIWILTLIPKTEETANVKADESATRSSA